MREPLSRERVLAAAVALADAEGVPALTMRRLAKDLGVEAMSLYHHLPGKDALLDGLVESVVGEIVGAVDDERDDDWQVTLRRWFLTAREVMLRHPWAPALLGRGRPVPPVLYLYYEKILATLIGAGFSYRIAHRALHAFGSMPLGFVQETFGGGDDEDPDAEEAALAAMAEAMPHLAAMVAAELHAATDPTLGWCDSQVEFQFTLDLLLDGLERCRVEPM
ncbi:TetR/AcrR family transcriptional regulator C-terminal domain-containing protein [Luedemannella flava]|uniref:TetR/AcrR family transcriptional regulator C-terminal domain-containing protein n=1 Tax=Luedemannella flava TaxID=349316 RepID=A0ABP4YML7_9ACTN